MFRLPASVELPGMTSHDLTSVLYSVAAMLTALAPLIRASRKGRARLPRLKRRGRPIPKE
jgi:hypothetical protein